MCVQPGNGEYALGNKVYAFLGNAVYLELYLMQHAPYQNLSQKVFKEWFAHTPD